MTLVLGADVDNYDLAVSVDQFKRFYGNGGRFCIVGCQTGADGKNYTLTQILNAQDAGLRVPFVYEFLYWDDRDMDRMRHAASFGLPVAIDCEWQTGMSAGPDATVQRIQQAKDLLISLNAYWGIYTGAWWWPGTTRNSTAFAGDPLWHAAYPYGQGKLPPVGFLPDLSTFQPYGGWTRPTVQQFADVCYDEPTWDMNAMEMATSEESSEVQQEGDVPENYPGEANERRARELLAWALYNGKVKVAFTPDGQHIQVAGVEALEVPAWAKPS